MTFPKAMAVPVPLSAFASVWNGTGLSQTFGRFSKAPAPGMLGPYGGSGNGKSDAAAIANAQLIPTTATAVLNVERPRRRARKTVASMATNHGTIAIPGPIQ